MKSMTLIGRSLTVAAEARSLLLAVDVDHAEHSGIHENGREPHVARSLGGCDDERVGAVDRDVHVEQAERPADDPRREVVGHLESCA
jgi:hypothetical protein